MVFDLRVNRSKRIREQGYDAGAGGEAIVELVNRRDLSPIEMADYGGDALRLENDVVCHLEEKWRMRWRHWG